MAPDPLAEALAALRGLVETGTGVNGSEPALGVRPKDGDLAVEHFLEHRHPNLEHAPAALRTGELAGELVQRRRALLALLGRRRLILHALGEPADHHRDQ